MNFNLFLVLLNLQTLYPNEFFEFKDLHCRNSVSYFAKEGLITNKQKWELMNKCAIPSRDVSRFDKDRIVFDINNR